ncbi:hypothetical protein ACFLQ0_06410 [Nitrospinota bacterium]
MQQWEYQMLEIVLDATPDLISSKLTFEGGFGWELVAMVPAIKDPDDLDYGFTKMLAFMKRPIEVEDDDDDDYE